MGHVIAVTPASGGVGATTFAAAAAVRGQLLAGRAEWSVVAVDLDRFAGRLDVVLGVEREPGWRWPRLEGGGSGGAPGTVGAAESTGVDGMVDGDRLREQLPRFDEVAVLAFGSGGCLDGSGIGDVDRWRDIIPDVLAGLVRSHDLVVLDVPRDEEVIAAAAPFVDRWVVVVGTEIVQLATSDPAVARLRTLVDLCGAGYFRCEPWIVLSGRGVTDELVDTVTDHLDAPVLAVIGPESRVSSAVVSGRPPAGDGRGRLVEAVDAVLVKLLAEPPRQGWHDHQLDATAQRAMAAAAGPTSREPESA